MALDFRVWEPSWYDESNLPRSRVAFGNHTDTEKTKIEIMLPFRGMVSSAFSRLKELRVMCL